MKTTSTAFPAVLFTGLVVCLFPLSGCHEDTSATSEYREYSELVPLEKQQIAVEVASPEIPAPAIAEKRNQPAIAEASDKRLQQTSQVVASNAVPGRPRELVLDNTDAAPREIKLLIPEKRFTKANADGTLRVSYDDLDLLKVLNMDPVPLDVLDYLPDWLEQLDGKRVQIRGFMVPAELTTGLRGFTLARDNAICCFGRNPKVYDLVEVRMKEGTTTDYLPNRPFDVVGTFHLLPPEPEDKVLFRLYFISDAQVITGRSR